MAYDRGVIRNCRGGSNDDKDAETMTATTTADGGGERWEQREIGRGSAAPPRVNNTRQMQLMLMPMLALTSTSASRNDCIGTSQRQW